MTMTYTYTLTYTDILRTMELSSPILHRISVEAELRSLPYHVYEILRIHEQLQMAWQRSCGYHSPTIQSADAAFYLHSDGPAGDSRVMDWMDAEDRLMQALRPHEEAYYSLARRLSRLSPDEIELLSLLYERQLPTRTVADMRYCSKSTLLRERDRILDKL